MAVAAEPVAHTANIVGEGGEIILSQGAVLPWYSFTPQVAPAPIPAAAPTLQPLHVAPIESFTPPTVIALPNPTPVISPTPAPLAIEPIGLGILNPVTESVSLPPHAPISTYDALVNFGGGPYAGESRLTTGNLQPWYTSPVVQDVFGGTPTAEEQAAFTQNVVEEVRDTYLQSGLDVSLTTDPAAQAAHTLSVVANGGFPGNDRAIGIADIGGDGFSFIDKFTEADTVDELETSVAKNVAHELMHAFGVEHQDTTGNFLDAATNTWDALFDKSTTFGPDAVAKLAAADFQDRYDSVMMAGMHQTSDSHQAGTCSCQLASAQAVPEPATIAIWSILGIGAIVAHRRRRAA
jgi:MYXO-CTERM domain-containing protein